MASDVQPPAGSRTDRSGDPPAGSPLPGVTPALPAIAPPRKAGRFTVLRSEIPPWQSSTLAALCVMLCGVLWWALTAGETVEQRVLAPGVLPSPTETFADLPRLWFEDALTRNILVSLRRVVLGFALAAVVGVPLGVLCGCFRRMNAFFAPLTIVGRNIPVAAVIPLTFSLFGIGEFQKVMFIFIACVAFVIIDSATAVADVSSRYVDTAYTLGARRRQIILKVLLPLSMPSIFNSLRLLFGLAFGYIMLAELVKFGNESGGLGDIINIAQRRGLRSYILLVLMIIPLVALAIDRMLYWVQRQLFPYQYGSDGLLHAALRTVLRGWEDCVAMVWHPRDAAALRGWSAGRGAAPGVGGVSPAAAAENKGGAAAPDAPASPEES
jgi:ABC-type nitrate/sulfonate/bicarbonate transport system permease component